MVQFPSTIDGRVIRIKPRRARKLAALVLLGLTLFAVGAGPASAKVHTMPHCCGIA